MNKSFIEQILTTLDLSLSLSLSLSLLESQIKNLQTGIKKHKKCDAENLENLAPKVVGIEDIPANLDEHSSANELPTKTPTKNPTYADMLTKFHREKKRKESEKATSSSAAMYAKRAKRYDEGECNCGKTNW